MLAASRRGDHFLPLRAAIGFEHPEQPMERFVSAGLCATAFFSVPRASAQTPAPDGSDWRDGGVCYEIFVRSFYDSDGDGVGDLAGLIRKLDYVNDGDPDSGEDLGARCIWLMPIAASVSYHGYDVTDYYRIDPYYGSNEDFKRLIEEAHRRDIRCSSTW
jgi:1,4-alpha-glucan branching enzyme